MADRAFISISKMDVLMEDFSNIQSFIDELVLDKENLIKVRNTWEVFFTEYDDDPREISEIPEVVNWIKQSVEEGIPWFYFMRCTEDTMGLPVFLTCCGADKDPIGQGRYIFNKDRLLLFIQKNLKNLEEFTEKYDIPEEICNCVTDDVMGFISHMITGEIDGEQMDREKKRERDKLEQEALERLTLLEKYYGLNPNVRKYFSEGKLYYSYITGGFIGSIDTIHYDKRYVNIVNSFEEETEFLVYHVIEHKDTIALLFVSKDYSDWIEERPSSNGVMAFVVNVNTDDKECGYIKLDVLQGALRRRDDKVYTSLAGHLDNDDTISEIDSEVVERLEILKNVGILTDLDVSNIYLREQEMCFSKLQNIMGMQVCVVNRLSAKPSYEKLADLLAEQVPHTLYFLMVSEDNKLVFLFVSEDREEWEFEKQELEEQRPYAIVVDTEDMTASIQRIQYKMVNGGPLCLL